MSQSTRIISAFLLIFGFSLPLNVLSSDVQDLTIYAVLGETFQMKYTGKAVEIFPPVTTNNTITGGFLGKTVYQLHKLAYYWRTDYLTYIFSLQVNIIYFNPKYKSYENALSYPDGIVQVIAPIFANGLIDNPKYNKFEQVFDQVKSNPGQMVDMNNKDLVGWFKAIAKWQTFYTYYQSYYYDGDIGKSNPSATTVNVPMVALQRYLSCRQFISTFGSLVDSSKRPLQNPAPLNIPTSLVEIGWEVKFTAI